jgi:hypothetical protein
MRIKIVLLSAFFALALPTTLLADTYEYQFTGSSYEDYADFTFYNDSLITSQTTVTPTSCSYNLGGGAIDCDSVGVDLFNVGIFYLEPTETWEDALEFQVPISLTDIGTQTDSLGDTLIITDTSSAAATPEPSSIALLGTGILSFAGIARRRFVSKAPGQTVTGGNV